MSLTQNWHIYLPWSPLWNFFWMGVEVKFWTFFGLNCFYCYEQGQAYKNGNGIKGLCPIQNRLDFELKLPKRRSYEKMEFFKKSKKMAIFRALILQTLTNKNRLKLASPLMHPFSYTMSLKSHF